MTIQKTENTIAHLGDGVTVIFAYDFRVDNEEYMHIAIDGVEYEGAFQVTGLGDPLGGEVTFLGGFIPAEGSNIVLYRKLDLKQTIDYRDYDAFPAETHEHGLDNLTMMLQQHDERITSSLRMPVGDTAGVELPFVDERALSYLFFDSEGNATVVPYQPPLNAVVELKVKEDQRDVLLSVNSSDNRFPVISFANINQPNGPVQLNSNGKVPFSNIGFTGLQIIGTFRGDDLCPKQGDDPGDCTAPDARNPSERFPELVPTYPGEPGKFNTGDTFILAFEEPEISGTMNLFSERGELTPVIRAVEPRDGIIFISGWDDNGDPIPGTAQGWYHVPKLSAVGDATSIVYDPTGRVYIAPSDNNVQLALTALDNELVVRDQYYLTQKDTIRSALVETTNANLIDSTGMYLLEPGASNSPDDTVGLTISHISAAAGEATQIAVSLDDGKMYIRAATGGSWDPWKLMPTTPAEIGAPAGSWSWDGSTLNITIP